MAAVLCELASASTAGGLRVEGRLDRKACALHLVLTNEACRTPPKSPLEVRIAPNALGLAPVQAKVEIGAPLDRGERRAVVVLLRADAVTRARGAGDEATTLPVHLLVANWRMAIILHVPLDTETASSAAQA
jgi:hypothetical protein